MEYVPTVGLVVIAVASSVLLLANAGPALFSCGVLLPLTTAMASLASAE